MKFKFIDWYKGAKVHIVFTPCAKCWVSLHPVITNGGTGVKATERRRMIFCWPRSRILMQKTRAFMEVPESPRRYTGSQFLVHSPE